MDITPNSQQKSQLAKLMATENITVQHAKAQTASFHPVTRVLTCPIWEDMSGSLYDLLMGHEVGHALYTPADGWHTAVCDRGQKYKSFLNVIEDPRIEKKIKRKYPGLRSSFIRGYENLMNRDFFGIKDRNLDELPFIDRLNILTKSDYTLNINFTDYEEELVEKVKDCETWEDVLRVTEEIWNYSKDEQSKMKQFQQEYFVEDSDGDETGTKSGESDDDGEESDQEFDRGEPGEPGDGEEDEDEDEEFDEDGNKINRDKRSQNANKDIEPKCETDEAFRNNEQKLLDAKSRTYFYAELPTPILKNIITPVARVHEILTEEFKKQCVDYDSVVQTLYDQFRKKNERYIGLLAKEFEMRKAASKFAKAKVASTGDIDVNKIYKYQLDDSIFKKIMRVPKGKSHGLVLLLDKSGSMQSNLSASFEQILILSTFCRKVNIPFTVYGYGNSELSRVSDFPNEDGHAKCFTNKTNEMVFSNVYLREYLNSNMGNAQFLKAVKNILALMTTFKGNWKANYFYRTPAEALSNTPMTEALVAVKPLIEKFRENNNLDIVNTVVVHDGDADKIDSTYSDNQRHNSFSPGWMNVFINDKKNKVQVQVKHDELNSDGVRWAVSEWLTKTTGTKIIGFFLADENYLKNALRRRLFNEELNKLRGDPKTPGMADALNKYARALRKEKFLESKNTGYSSFFILPAGNSLSVTDDEFEAPAKVNATNLTKAFMKYNKTRQINRVLVSRFIGLIAV